MSSKWNENASPPPFVSFYERLSPKSLLCLIHIYQSYPLPARATSFGDTIPKNHHCHLCYHISLATLQASTHQASTISDGSKRQRVREIQIPLNQQHTHILFETHLMKTLPRSQIYFRHSRAELWDVSGVHPLLLHPSFLPFIPPILLPPSCRSLCDFMWKWDLGLWCKQSVDEKISRALRDTAFF